MRSHTSLQTENPDAQLSYGIHPKKSTKNTNEARQRTENTDSDIQEENTKRQSSEVGKWEHAAASCGSDGLLLLACSLGLGRSLGLLRMLVSRKLGLVQRGVDEKDSDCP